jgi:DNA-binding winged helix-turn-helix (wHTH) protein
MATSSVSSVLAAAFPDGWQRIRLSAMTTERIAFGPFELDPARGTLLRAGRPVPLGHRASALLAALVAAEGRTVAKADLMGRA